METTVPDKLNKKDQREYVINLIAHVNHGKTTVMDNVLEYLGVISKSMAGEARLLDSRKDELEREMTMKLSPVSLFVGGAKITFLDTPGHLEFKSLTESTFIISDISLVIVDVMKGVTERLRQLVRNSSDNRCTPLILINKIDSLFKLGSSGDEIEHRVSTIIQNLREVVSVPIDWDLGNIIIGSAKDNWSIGYRSIANRIVGKDVGKLTMKKALRIVRTVYAQRSAELLKLSERVNRKVNPGLKDRIQPKDIVSHEFGFFSALHASIVSIQPADLVGEDISANETSLAESDVYSMYNQIYHKESTKWISSGRSTVLAVICSNTLVEGTITAIGRTLHGQSLSVGDSVMVVESTGISECKIENLIYFTKTFDNIEVAEGLVGIQGLGCKKKGIICASGGDPEEAKKQLNQLKWPIFTPLFTDVITPAAECYSSVIERLTRLSRCEPGLFLSAKQGKIIVRSDGVLQMDKIKTDLEGLNFTTEDQSEVYQETVTKGYGVVKTQADNEHKNYAIYLSCAEDSLEEEMERNGYRRLFGRECYVKYPENAPHMLKMSISALLQNGPFLQEQCNKIAVEAVPTEDLPTGTLSQIYLESNPRLLTNHTILYVSVPSVYAKATNTTLVKCASHILSTNVEESTICFEVRIPVAEIKQLTNVLRTQTKGEADILPTQTLYYTTPDKIEHEQALTLALRERKGLFRKERIE
ncbi:elongation factor 2 [Nematocida parisii]|nr:elongation factor 2 [Nematocida parisii]KAI5127279.1 elongation factor 2 [Nematocida parisii]KAI5141387.1 elongation factor 2 [Nematocida parisii]